MSVDCKKQQDALEIALKYLPKGYESYYLTECLQVGSVATIEAQILSYTRLQSTARVRLYAPLLEQEIQAIIFHPKPFHQTAFKPHTTCFLQGRWQDNPLTLIQPKQIPQSKVNTIALKFKPSPLKTETILTTIKENITPSNLALLPAKYSKALLEIYFPSIEFLSEYQKNGGFFGEYLEAIKFLEVCLYSRDLRKKKLSFPPIKQFHTQAQDFIDTLNFNLTEGQRTTIADIQKDFKSSKAARRIIVGDVGCGKTLVMLCAAFMSYPNRSVIMAPTSILARQIYNQACLYLPKSFKIALVTQQDNSKEDIEADCIIGTHALLYRNLKDVSLVMIDEQHRFGTMQRNKLEKTYAKGQKRVHFLQFSATPIPRTLAMIETNFIDFSFIRDLPYPKDIQTSIITKEHFSTLLEHIKTEISKGNQCAIIYPLVEEGKTSKYLPLSQAQEYWKKHFEGVYVTHGKDTQKDNVLENFAKDGNILLSTTVIEVGISLPKLSTIVIVGAERFGLATLHQLRGRVSRNGLKGYCFLFTYGEITERLQRFCETQNGFEIAELDLEFRNSGDLLNGVRQSGKTFEYFEPARDHKIAKEAQDLLENTNN